MLGRGLFDQAVTVVRAADTTDRYGNTVPDWDAAVEFEIGPLAVQPSTQSETNDALRDATVTGWRVFSAPGTDPDVRATDRLKWQGGTYEVTGEIGRWTHPPTGATHHVEFLIQKVTG